MRGRAWWLDGGGGGDGISSHLVDFDNRLMNERTSERADIRISICRYVPKHRRGHSHSVALQLSIRSRISGVCGSQVVSACACPFLEYRNGPNLYSGSIRIYHIDRRVDALKKGR